MLLDARTIGSLLWLSPTIRMKASKRSRAAGISVALRVNRTKLCFIDIITIVILAYTGTTFVELQAAILAGQVTVSGIKIVCTISVDNSKQICNG